MNLTLGWILRVSIREGEREGKSEWEKERENERGRIRFRTPLVLLTVYRFCSLEGKCHCTTEPRLVLRVQFRSLNSVLGNCFSLFLTNNLPNRTVKPMGQSV